MRELANQSARNAIKRSSASQTKKTQTKAFSKFLQAGIAILCGLAAFVFVTGMLKLIAAGAALVIAFVCINEGGSLVKANQSRPTKHDGTPE